MIVRPGPALPGFVLMSGWCRNGLSEWDEKVDAAWFIQQDMVWSGIRHGKGRIFLPHSLQWAMCTASMAPRDMGQVFVWNVPVSWLQEGMVTVKRVITAVALSAVFVSGVQ